MIISSAHHEVQAISKSTFQIRMILTIRNLQEQDFGSYTCAAKNSLGEVDFSIRLYSEFKEINQYLNLFIKCNKNLGKCWF